MLAKHYRLPSGTYLPRHGAIIQPSIVIRFRQNNLPLSRFGFLVSKKVSKKAVERNTIRRRLQACVQECLSSVVSGYDVLIVAQPSSIDQSKQELCDQVIKAFRQKGLLQT